MAQLEAVLRRGGLIEGEDTPEAILGEPRGPVFRPGPRAEANLPEGFGSLKDLLTNGVEFCPKPVFNWYQLDREDFTCPNCKKGYDTPSLVDQIDTAAAEARFGDDVVTCPGCNAKSGVNAWSEGAGFILAGCGIALWNWQVMDEILDPIRACWREVFPEGSTEDGGKI